MSPLPSAAVQDSYSADAETTRQSLINLYVTAEKDALEAAEGCRSTIVRKLMEDVDCAKLIERNYYDIFMFDLDGNLIYSVFKETDYGTNFRQLSAMKYPYKGPSQQAKHPSSTVFAVAKWRANGNGTWKDSALGQDNGDGDGGAGGDVVMMQLFRDDGGGDAYNCDGNNDEADFDEVAASADAKDNITYIDFTPYGPSNGAQAAFLATGVFNEVCGLGFKVWLFGTSEFRSIEAVEPQCSFEAIESAFMGSMNLRDNAGDGDDNHGNDDDDENEERP
ncbi:hypothetical protein AK812_SmicGene6607 [Symbiodinium microadriaticum]|uniref:Uncharacterized protein n=1 Tax=Symbiodinium microadriaticum TaxID=2951 RepID=A0A1Q9EQT0_SYMMI|nr:hypothetical protein AK812_SmicGene6607 [Symbiodinium microadriaticum]